MQEAPRQRTAWFIVFVLLLASVAAPLNQFKVPPLMPILMDAFSLPLGTAGLLMSVFSMTGLILALPAGFIVQKLGFKITGMLAIGAVALGAAIGALAINAGTMFAARVVEGVGTSLIVVTAPAVIAMWFVADRRGAPMGVWGTWVPVGSTIMFVTAPLLAAQGSWQRVWWFGFIYALVAGLLFWLFVKPPHQGAAAGGGSSAVERTTGRDLKPVLQNRDLWLISFVFCCFNIAFIGFVTWAPTYLNRVHGVPLARAAFMVSLIPMLNIVSCPFSGWLSDRIGSRKWIIVIPMILMAFLWPLVTTVGEPGFLVLVIILGWISGFTPIGLFAAAPELVTDERLSGMAVAILLVGLNAGMLLGPLVLGRLIQTGGWSVAFTALVPVCAVGAIAGLGTRLR
jgi:MFS family permease